MLWDHGGWKEVMKTTSRESEFTHIPHDLCEECYFVNTIVYIYTRPKTLRHSSRSTIDGSSHGRQPGFS